MTMFSDAELHKTLSTVESFHKESLTLKINPLLPPAILAQCSVSYHRFVESVIKSFGVQVLNENIDANVELIYKSSRNQVDGLIRFGCTNLRFAVNSVKLALKKSNHDNLRAMLKFNGIKNKLTIIEYSVPDACVLPSVVNNHQCKIYKYGDLRNVRQSSTNSR